VVVIVVGYVTWQFFTNNDQLLPMTHPTSVDNPIAIAHPLLSPYYKMKKGDRTSSTTSTALYGMKSRLTPI
jgi:hypothetical protein